VRRLTTVSLRVPRRDAEGFGVAEHDRKLRIPAFVGAFVSGFAVDESRTLAGFRRCHNSTADETISPSGFCRWLTPTLAEYLRGYIEHRIDDLVA